jgi:hypothetical protein
MTSVAEELVRPESPALWSEARGSVVGAFVETFGYPGTGTGAAAFSDR